MTRLGEGFRRIATRLISSPRVSSNRWLLAIAAVALIVGTVLAIRALPGGWEGVRIGPLLLSALVASTLSLALNAGEFAVLARILAVGFSAVETVRISVMGSAANLLPLPGAAATRIAAFSEQGVRLRRAGIGLGLVAATWVSVALVLAGAATLESTKTIGIALLGFGFVGLGLGLVGLARLGNNAIAAMYILLLELALVLVQALRLWLAARAVSIQIDFGEAAALGVSGPLAAAIGFLPAGLGLKEAISVAIGSAAGLDPAASFLVAIADRVASLGAYSVASVLVLFRFSNGSKRNGTRL